MTFFSYQLTWERIKEMAAKGVRDDAVVSFQGYLLLSRDRKLEERHALELYRQSIQLALQKGKEIPREVLLENQDLVAKFKPELLLTLHPVPAAAPAPSSKTTAPMSEEEEEGELMAFG